MELATYCLLHGAGYILLITWSWLHTADYMELATYCLLHGAGYILLITWSWLHTADYMELATYCLLHGAGYILLITWSWLHTDYYMLPYMCCAYFRLCAVGYMTWLSTCRWLVYEDMICHIITFIHELSAHALE